MYDHTVLNSIWRGTMGKGERERERRESPREREVGGFGLMTPGLSKDIQCHDHILF